MAENLNLGNETDGEDDGFVIVTFKSETPEKLEKKLDIFEWSSKLNEYWKAHGKETAHQYNEGLCNLIEQEAGLPRPSHAVAQQFQRGIDNLATDLLKKKGLMRGSADSTASTHGH